MIFEKNKILEIQQNRDPYLMIDHATEVIPGERSKGYKILNEDEWFFKVHWPGDPNMPGMLQLEALVQMSSLALLSLPGNEGKLIYLLNVENASFKKKVTPKNKLILHTEIVNFKRGIANVDGQAMIDDHICCIAKFKVVLPHKIIKL